VRAASQADFDTANHKLKRDNFKVAVENAMGTSAEILSISVEISYKWVTSEGRVCVSTEVTVIMCSVSEYVLRSRDYAKRTCAEVCSAPCSRRSARLIPGALWRN